MKKKIARKKNVARSRRGRTLEKYVGEVVVGLIHPDSKSERQAVKLDTGEGELVMRRPGIRAYKDDVLEGLVGQRVTFKGLKRGNKLYVKSWEVSGSDEPGEREGGEEVSKADKKETAKEIKRNAKTKKQQ